MTKSFSQDVSAFFVYGTLKKSQLRGSLWPRRPVTISPGIVQAELYDLGSYPSIWHGPGWVLGEVWHFAPIDLQATTEALDRIEGYDAWGQNNEYYREQVLVEILGEEGKPHETTAFAYLVAHPPRIQKARKIEPFLEFAGRRVSAWPDPKSRVPQSFAEE